MSRWSISNPSGDKRHVTKADLSFPVGPVNPETGERPRVKRIQGIPLETGFPVPWPMTPVGARLYMLIAALGTLTAIGIALWVGFALIEPSLMRLVPAVGVALAIKFLAIPALRAYGKRPGMDRQEAGGES